jgi:uncharacterized protein YbaP (TraB family)
MVKSLKHLPAMILLLLLVQPAANADGADAAHDVFWAVDGPAGPSGYLLGTVHSEDPRVLEFTGGFLERLASCDRFAMEIVPNIPTMQQLMAYMQLPEGESLELMIGPERFAALSEAFLAYGTPPGQLRRMKPWAATISLSLPPPRTGIFLDFQLSLRAAGNGLEVIGLETLEEQLDFLDSMSAEQQLELLDQALADQDRVAALHEQLVTTYLEGSLAELAELSEAQMDGLSPQTRRYFLSEGVDARNHRMLATALPWLAEGCTFMAVGALHLPGENGLLALLEAAGFTLRPLPSPFVAVSGPEPSTTAR